MKKKQNEFQVRYNSEEIKRVKKRYLIFLIFLEKPEFSEIEKDFFEGEKENLIEKEDDNRSLRKRKKEKDIPLLSVEHKNIEVISNISQNVRMRVRCFYLIQILQQKMMQILFHMKKISLKFLFKEDDKIAVFFFPNNSVVPDAKAEGVINENSKVYSE